MTREIRHPRRRWRAILITVMAALAATILPSATLAAEPNDMVVRWNAHAIAAIGNAPTATPPGLGQVPPLAPIQLAIVQLAVYDAVNAIDGGHEPYLDDVPTAASSASKAAAAIAAAHGVLVGLASASPTVVASLDATRDATLGEIPPGQRRDAGVAIGQAVAAEMLATRTGDGRPGAGTFPLGDAPGEWIPVAPASTNVFAGIGAVVPFSLKSGDQLRVEPPPALTSAEYAADFNEVKRLGAQVGSTRTPEQFSLAAWASGNPFVFANKGLRDIATAEGLSTAQQARLLAITSTASADALIACWWNKSHFLTWRPQTAIHMALDDGNAATAPDGTWRSLNVTPGYPDLPSGFNCLTAGLMYGARLYFGTDKMSFSLTSSGNPTNAVPLPGSTRTYTRFSDVIRDAIDGRVLNGLHFRHADVAGAWIGKKAAQWVNKHEFQPVD